MPDDPLSPGDEDSCCRLNLAYDLDETCRRNRELAAILALDRDDIIAHWADLVRELPGKGLQGIPQRNLHAMHNRALWAAIELFTKGIEAGLSVLNSTQAPFDLDIETNLSHTELVQILSLFTEAAEPLVRRAVPADSAVLAQDLAQLSRCQQWIIESWVDFETIRIKKCLHDRQCEKEKGFDIAEAVSTAMDADKVLTSVANLMYKAFGERFNCAVGLVDKDKGVLKVRHAIREELAEEVSSRKKGNIDRSIPYTELSPFSLDVLQHCRPVTVFDVNQDPWYQDNRPPLWLSKSMLVLPILVEDQLVGLAWFFTSVKTYVFTREEIELAQGMANIVALVLENVRLNQRIREQAVLDERHHLAQEMHDSVIQALGTINWRASTLDRLLLNNKIDSARNVVHDIKVIAKQSYTDVREMIFTFRSDFSAESEFVPMLEECLSLYRNRYGLSIALGIDVPSLPQFPEQTRFQIIRILQEALKNVAKYARTSRVRVIFEVEEGEMLVHIDDNGQGFELSKVENQKTHFGLSIMRERALSIGGRLDIQSKPGQGTQILLHVPIPVEEEGSSG